ncbi:unnamed protein product [Arctogadus glacialis]
MTSTHLKGVSVNSRFESRIEVSSVSGVPASTVSRRRTLVHAPLNTPVRQWTAPPHACVATRSPSAPQGSFTFSRIDAGAGPRRRKWYGETSLDAHHRPAKVVERVLSGACPTRAGGVSQREMGLLLESVSRRSFARETVKVLQVVLAALCAVKRGPRSEDLSYSPLL